MFNKVYYEVRLYYTNDTTETIFESEDSKGKDKASELAEQKAKEELDSDRIDEVLVNKWQKSGHRDNMGIDWENDWELEKQWMSRQGEIKSFDEVYRG